MPTEIHEIQSGHIVVSRSQTTFFLLYSDGKKGSGNLTLEFPCY